MRKPHQIIIIGLISILFFNACDRKSPKRELTKDNFHVFLKGHEKARIQDTFSAGLDSIYYFYANNDVDKHMEYSAALTGYLSRIPIPFLTFLCDSFMKRVDKEGLLPYLSIYIELGKRMLWFQSKESLKCYKKMKEMYENAAINGDNFLAAFSDFRDIHIISEDLAIAIGSILFSKIGQDFGSSMLSLNQYLEMINYAANCSNCGEEDQNNAPAFSQTRDILAQTFREVNYRFDGESAEGSPSVPCDQINTIFSNNMTDIGAANLCVAAGKSKSNGGIDKRLGCFVGITAAYFGEQKSDMWDNIRLFEEYVQCINSDLFAEKSPFDISYLMEDPGGGEETEPDSTNSGGGQKPKVNCQREDCRTITISLSGKPGGVGVGGGTQLARECFYYDENCNPTGSSITIFTGHQWSTTKQPNGTIVKKFSSQVTESVVTTTIDPTGYATEKYTVGSTEYMKDASGYYKKVGNRWRPVTKDEYERNKPRINPSPDDPIGNCGYLFEDDPPWVEYDPVTGEAKGIIEQNLPWINPGPDGDIPGGILGDLGAYLNEIEQCLSDQTFTNKCLTNLMCVPDDNIDQCTCLESNLPSFQQGNCENLVRCPEGTVKQGCACISPDGGDILPGIGSGIGPWTALLGHLEFPPNMQ